MLFAMWELPVVNVSPPGWMHQAGLGLPQPILF